MKRLDCKITGLVLYYFLNYPTEQ